ncbi:hypothetical protein F5X96DRAFT_668533 [Biscogniauxia mediterranea]|nr:hypothetical protein F5X96DRAFT_668533 [Biscogniauxia mediterranea]
MPDTAVVPGGVEYSLDLLAIPAPSPCHLARAVEQRFILEYKRPAAGAAAPPFLALLVAAASSVMNPPRPRNSEYDNMLHNDLPLLPSQRGGGGIGAAALPKLSPVVIPVWRVLVCTRWRSRLWGEPGNSDDTDGSWPAADPPGQPATFTIPLRAGALRAAIVDNDDDDVRWWRRRLRGKVNVGRVHRGGSTHMIVSNADDAVGSAFYNLRRTAVGIVGRFVGGATMCKWNFFMFALDGIQETAMLVDGDVRDELEHRHSRSWQKKREWQKPGGLT